MTGKHIKIQGFIRCFIMIVCIVLEAVVAIWAMVQIFKSGIKLCYYPFYRVTEKVFELPEYASEFVPQGLSYCEEEDVYLISGYIYKENESKIYVVKPDGSYRCVAVMKDDENPLRSHSGGICENGRYVYLAGGNGKCYVFNKKELLDEKNQSVCVAGDFKTGNTSSFCYADDEHLYIGEYYYRFKYVTRYDHHLTTPAGDANNAVMIVFHFNDEKKNGVERVPEMGLSITSRIQGMCMTNDGQLVLSASSIFQGSQLYYYNYNDILNGESGSLNVRGELIPLYYVDSQSLIRKKEILPKAEEITFQDGQIYMLFESACSRFQYGTLLDGQYVYSMPYED
ncbi:MAG: hypothetical protein PUC12_16375 [Clostridiales bacterium]|nr:hypothetical protein [Clostridiales bacterium]